MALREQYQKSRILLNNMKEDIRITTDKPCSSEMDLFNASPSSVGAYDEPEVILRINKDYHTGIGPYMRHVLRNTSRVFLYWDKDHAIYKLKDDGNYYFDILSHGDNQYNPKVIIPDFLQNEFANYYQELKSLDLYYLPYIVISNQPHISIDSSNILYTPSNTNYNVFSINYMAKDDTINIRTREFGATWGIHYRDLFFTEIPCYKIPKEYLEYLEKSNPKSYDPYDILIDDYIRRDGKFSIEEKEDKLVLKKVMKKK